MYEMASCKTKPTLSNRDSGSDSEESAQFDLDHTLSTLGTIDVHVAQRTLRYILYPG
jgi:hypothetical protein